MSFKNNRLLQAIEGKPMDRTPIWIMRQAGRYLPEYREIRAKAGSFMALCKNPELACEVTLQPLKRFQLDAAILFSDILTVPDALGLGLKFAEGGGSLRGPYFSHALQSEKAIYSLPKHLSVEELLYVYSTIRLLKHELNSELPLIGFSGSPWTLAAYMIEGKSIPNFPLAQKMLKTSPEALHHLLKILTEALVNHLHYQIAAGVDVVMIFDTWGGLLQTADFKNFSLYYISEVISTLRSTQKMREVPIILFTKGGHAWLEDMAQSGCNVLQVDWEVSLGEARRRVGKKVALQGNLNPSVLKEEPQVIRNHVKQILASYGHGSGHIFNCGHGLTPDIPPENVALLVDTVHEESQIYHRAKSIDAVVEL